MGNSAEILSGSVRTLNQDERLRVLKKSSLYKTKPWGLTEQAVFLNAVIEVSWTGEPEELMEFLLQVENHLAVSASGTGDQGRWIWI